MQRNRRPISHLRGKCIEAAMRRDSDVAERVIPVVEGTRWDPGINALVNMDMMSEKNERMPMRIQEAELAGEQDRKERRKR